MLYKRSFDGILLRYVAPNEADQILHECHHDICGGHFGGQSTAQRILRMGYYWPSLFKDAHAYALKCRQCQEHANISYVPSEALHPIMSLWPFSQWGLDLIGGISPPSSAQHKYILIATEYFTKWAEAIPLSTMPSKTIATFAYQHIICRFSILDVLITDNGTSFCNKEMDELCEKFKISYKTSSPYYPPVNRQVESFNKTLVNILKKTVAQSQRDWHLQLPSALWAYHTSIRTATRTTPFSLVYETEVVLPLEVEIPSLRVSLRGLIDEEFIRQARLLDLEALDERRLMAYQVNLASKAHLQRTYDKRLCAHPLCSGDHVLKLEYFYDRLAKFGPK